MSDANESNSRSKDRSRKRKYVSHKGGPENKKRKTAPHEVDLTKGRNLILCSAQRMKEVLCGKDLQLVFSEHIQELLDEQNKQDDTVKETDINIKSVENEENKKQETDIKVLIKPIDNENENNDQNEDGDLKTNENKNKDKDDKAEKEKEKEKEEEEEEEEDDDINSNKNTKELSIADQIKNELSNYNASKLCEWIKGPPGLVIIDILEPSISASTLLEYTFNKYAPKKPPLSPFVFKLFPLNCTSFSREDDMINLGKMMIQNKDWTKISKDDSFAIDYKNRGNKKNNRPKIIDAIAKSMPDGYKVDLKNPKTVICLQTFGRNCGISIITNGVYAKHNKYNLTSFAE